MKDHQQQAIEKVQGPCVILAGAGTGKSHTIIEKIAHLVESKKYKANEILCLTFSNEATNSLKRKLLLRLKADDDVTVKTFHGFCADIVRQKGYLLGINQTFDIVLPEDATLLVHKYLNIKPYWANRYVKTIATAKDFGITKEQIQKYTDDLRGKLSELCPSLALKEQYEKYSISLQTIHLKSAETKEERAEIKESKRQYKEYIELYLEFEQYTKFIQAWENYTNLKRSRNLLDFSDLNELALTILRRHGAEELLEQYKYIFVDEFQDTNKLQFELLEHIAPHRNITVVGDPNQSIYGFRGSYKECFNHFKKVFEVTQDDIFTLDKSRRSPNTVLKVSHELIKNNYENVAECFFVTNFYEKVGSPVKSAELVNGEEEARYIADSVDALIQAETLKKEICVLVRTHKQSRLIQQAFDAKRIPYITAGKINLLYRPEIRTAVAYLGILNNLIQRTGIGEQSWWHLFTYKNSLLPEDMLKIGRFLKEHKEDSIDNLLLTNLSTLKLTENGAKIVKRVAEQLQTILKSINKQIPDLILDIYEISGLSRAFSHERSIANVESLLNLSRLYDLAVAFCENHEGTLTAFIDYIEMIDAVGINVEASRIESIDAVRIMTIHAVKGLEFKHVFVSNLAEDRFPLSRTPNDPLIPKVILHKELIKQEMTEKEIEKAIKDFEKASFLFEERRLCYVAFTRTQDQLVLTYARSYDAEPDSSSPSIFLQEINFKESTSFVSDANETSSILAPNSRYEQYKSQLKNQLVQSLDSDNVMELKERLASYLTCRDKKITAIEGVDVLELEKHLIQADDEQKKVLFDKTQVTFSPTALLDYDECPKKYEFARLLHLPARGEFVDESGGADTGSFIHKVAEEFVKRKLQTKEELFALSEELGNDWPTTLEKEDIKQLLTVFYIRNRNKINTDSKTEMPLSTEAEGLRFFGIADRYDPTGEIVDYKTNKSALTPKKRAWQLGYYLWVLREKGFDVKKLTLDMLRLEKPVEMTVEGDIVSGPDGRTEGFNLAETKKELIDTAKKIVIDFEKGFAVAETEKPCKFCGYKLFCPKWEEK